MDETKTELTHYAAYVENYHIYLGLTFKVEDEASVKEITIPKIDLGIKTDDIFIETQYDYLDEYIYIITETGNKLPLKRDTVYGTDKNGNHFKAENVRYIEIIKKEKSKKMTLSEIEKKLGHKIELVSEENANE